MEDIRRQEVRQLARLTARLDPTQQIFFQAEYSLHRRNPTTALLLCVLLGDFGAHYFYFGRYRAGILRLLFCWTLVPGILALFDARTMTARARRYNASLANELVLALQSAVEEQAHAGMVEAAQRAPVVSVRGRRAALAAPISTPEMEAIAAAAWVEREPQQDDPRDPPISVDGLDDVDSLGEIEEMDPAASLATHWPNALARPVAPEPYLPNTDEPHDLGPDDDIPVWPAPDAPDGWLDEAWAYPALPDSHASHDIAAADAAAAAATWSPVEERYEMETPSPSLAAALDTASLVVRDEPFAGFADGTIAPEDDALSASDASDADTAAIAAERELVMLYQVAPAPRRESVHLGPPLPAAYSRDDLAVDASYDPRLANVAGSTSGAPSKSGRAGEDQATLAALGSVLASGLAELLRERPSTRPITRPITTRPITTRPIAASIPQPALAPPPPQEELVAPSSQETASTDQPDQFGQPPPAAEEAAQEAYAIDTNYGANPLRAIAPDAPVEAATHLYDENWLLSLMPVTQPLRPAPATPAAVLAPIAESLPLPVHPVPVPARAPISLNLRRRVVQRVIVRKMAVLDGQVVAEATVERQVPVIHNDAEMAARIRMATRDAAREALGYLLMQAPEEARLSIREQLDAMRQPAE